MKKMFDPPQFLHRMNSLGTEGGATQANPRATGQVAETHGHGHEAHIVANSLVIRGATWLAGVLKGILNGSGTLSQVLGEDGVGAFRKFGSMSIRLGDVSFMWIAFFGLSVIFIPGDTWVVGLVASIAGFYISTGTFQMVSIMWDVMLGIGETAKKLPTGIKWVVGILTIPINLLDSLVDSLAAPVITGLFLLLARYPYTEWERVANENALLVMITLVLAVLFFLFSFFGELITKIIEIGSGKIKQNTAEANKASEAAKPAATNQVPPPPPTNTPQPIRPPNGQIFQTLPAGYTTRQPNTPMPGWLTVVDPSGIPVGYIAAN